ncbi:hypothetical protein Msil_2766 [Methylocella silvestris BL2]|uniref:Uncharacterized protein n=1 Tax=Methylocella silvestris (strain DSM 15510 / CIP 108128 / LMG 27833 / NCIMB 13906 / BL2) TaxID=395965 RepID=B8ERY8_METSB|nr:hypothetical protein [Methylocella silvestris]ACK51686.1 hypothetical protein Msil_2766 [Methylocella silvestris BL2]
MSAVSAESRIVGILPKLAKFLRLLSSDKEGEVFAAVAAINRTLARAGCDCNDLAGMIERPLRQPGASRWSPAKASSRRGYRRAPLCSELTAVQRQAWLSAIHGQHWLSVWELDFVAEMLARDEASLQQMSANQEAAFNRIIDRAFSMGVRS